MKTENLQETFLNQLRKKYSTTYKSFFFSNFKDLKKKLESSGLKFKS